MKRISLFAAPLAALVLAIATPAAAEPKALTVVELFTSQGCSSCPPADAYLGELARRGVESGVLPLSMHVDYWDYLGWKDTFSSPAATARQRRYATAMRLRYVYTPQIVIQGALQTTGSNRVDAAAKIAEAARLPHIDVDLSADGGRLRIGLAGNTAADPAEVVAVAFDRAVETVIRRGENRGKTITYHNVVRAIRKLGVWSGAADTIEAEMIDDTDAVAVIVQRPDGGPILGAGALFLR